jgi:hypothetical protein
LKKKFVTKARPAAGLFLLQLDRSTFVIGLVQRRRAKLSRLRILTGAAPGYATRRAYDRRDIGAGYR